MSFSSLSSYQTTLLFSSWKITTVWEYMIAWVGVFGAAAMYHRLRLELSVNESKITIHKLQTTNYETTPLMSSSSSSSSSKVPSSQLRRICIIHSILSALSYAYALILMLIAMTYNTGLFIALIVGYGVGDFLYFTRREPVGFDSNSDSDANCH